MADSKITALTALTAADPVNDMFPVVDVSDTSMAASGTTKKISVNNILSSSPTASGALTVTGLVTAGSATITGAATVGTTLGVTGVATFAAGTVSLPALTTTGDTNTGIYYPAADTFAVTTGGTERFRSHSFGFGVGLTPINGNGKFQVLGGDGYDGQFTLTAQFSDVTTAAAKGVLIGYNNTTNNGIIASAYGNGTEGLQFWTHNGSNWGSRMTLGATGNLAFPTGKGIDFSAVTGGTGTATANVLNDYEEGTWVGTLTGSTTNPTVPVTATGRYTKIGRLVTVSINYESVSTAGASGNIGISGLPFANNASVQSVGPTSIYQAGTFTGSPFVRVDTAASVIEFFASVSNANYSNVTHNAGTGRFIATSITYTVA